MNVFNRDILCHENGCPFKIPIVRVNQFYRIPFLIHHCNAHLSSETIELSIHSMVRTRGNRCIKTSVCISCSRTNFKSCILARTQCASWSGEVRVLSILRVRHQCHLVLPKLPIAHKRTRNRSGDGVNIIIAIALTIPTKVRWAMCRLRLRHQLCGHRVLDAVLAICRNTKIVQQRWLHSPCRWASH